MKEDKLIRLRQEITQGDYRDYRPRRISVTTVMVKSTAEQQQLPFLANCVSDRKARFYIPTPPHTKACLSSIRDSTMQHNNWS